MAHSEASSTGRCAPPDLVPQLRMNLFLPVRSRLRARFPAWPRRADQSRVTADETDQQSVSGAGHTGWSAATPGFAITTSPALPMGQYKAMDELNEYEQYLAWATRELALNGNKKLCEVRDYPTIELVEELENILASAKDEKPLQEFFTAHPEMLSQQLDARCRWIIPKPQLGGLFEPDFFAARIDSGGIKWVAIELESPAVDRLFTKSKGFPQEKLREGIEQIRDWRNWIENNLATARNSPLDDGSGLVGITSRLHGMVIIGRREESRREDQRRRRDIEWESKIEIHTYDWVLEQARKMTPIHPVAIDECEECDLYGR